MGDGGVQVTSFVLNHMKIADMRPREDFERFDQVHVIGTGITGRIERIDADRRLAWLITAQKDGWWYLKDLEKTYFISRRAAEKSFLTTNNTKNTKKEEQYFIQIAPFEPLRIPAPIVEDALCVDMSKYFGERARRSVPLQVQ